ncbi:MAG: 4a-hydroxytetrahydrobiopterin dehydratase [Betaproteobacteria bacterium]|nr:4a-hydroxytetrahydrobiopterin dehydratase [Betaproteobacteria bacterium]MDE2055603.1 4a-hydroxytetrahydrobiopterin dehydratase [Betaproteobacteria bacterium]
MTQLLPLTDQDIAQALSQTLNNWSYVSQRLIRKWHTKNWLESMAVVNQISIIAEKEQHHPNLTIKYSEVIVELYTHDINAITRLDVILADAIEKDIQKIIN